MFDCLILGDSIAVGTASIRQECVSYSHGGWNSWQWNKKYLGKDRKELNANTVIISLGTNDHSGVNTFQELLKLRNNVRAGSVYWIMPPIKPEVQEVVKIIANNFGDTIIKTDRLQQDKIHPSWAGYKELARMTK